MVVPRKPRKIRGHPGASWHPCAKHAHAAHFSEPFSTLGISWDPISATSAEGRTGQRNDVPNFHFRAGSVGSRWSGQRSSEVKPQPEQCWSTKKCTESQGFFQQSWKVSFATRSSGYPGLRKCQGAFGWSHATQPVQSPKVVAGLLQYLPRLWSGWNIDSLAMSWINKSNN